MKGYLLVFLLKKKHCGYLKLLTGDIFVTFCLRLKEEKSDYENENYKVTTGFG